MPRGSIWPFGLYICPVTHRFFCFFHNETGWNGEGTAYDCFGLCETPKFDSDFRHVGLMHSDDEGRHWRFDRWVLTGCEAALTDRFDPGAGRVIGQRTDVPVRLGAGDFTLFAPPDGEYLYIFYDILTLDLNAGDIADAFLRCDAYVARCRKRTDGLLGDFVKFYDGAFSEPGLLGRESPIAKNAWHARAAYYVPDNRYFLTSTRVTPLKSGDGVQLVDDVMQIRTGKTLTEWDEPITVFKDGKEWGNHYVAFVSDDACGQPEVLTSDGFSLLSNHNGTDVIRYKVKITDK